MSTTLPWSRSATCSMLPSHDPGWRKYTVRSWVQQNASVNGSYSASEGSSLDWRRTGVCSCSNPLPYLPSEPHAFPLSLGQALSSTTCLRGAMRAPIFPGALACVRAGPSHPLGHRALNMRHRWQKMLSVYQALDSRRSCRPAVCTRSMVRMSPCGGHHAYGSP